MRAKTKVYLTLVTAAGVAVSVSWGYMQGIILFVIGTSFGKVCLFCFSVVIEGTLYIWWLEVTNLLFEKDQTRIADKPPEAVERRRKRVNFIIGCVASISVVAGFLIYANGVAVHSHTNLTVREVSTTSAEYTFTPIAGVSNLVVGREYTISGILHDGRTGDLFLDDSGNTVTASVTFTATATEMDVALPFVFTSSADPIVLMCECWIEGVLGKTVWLQ